MEKILDYAIAARVPALFWGPPGVGKSASIKSYCINRGYQCITIIASHMEP